MVLLTIVKIINFAYVIFAIRSATCVTYSVSRLFFLPNFPTWKMFGTIFKFIHQFRIWRSQDFSSVDHSFCFKVYHPFGMMYRSSPLFTDAERAALDYVTELTKNRTVNPETFARLAQYYSEREICEIVWLVASEHLYNMTNIGLNIHSDMLYDITKKNKSR